MRERSAPLGSSEGLAAHPLDEELLVGGWVEAVEVAVESAGGLAAVSLALVEPDPLGPVAGEHRQIDGLSPADGFSERRCLLLELPSPAIGRPGGGAEEAALPGQGSGELTTAADLSGVLGLEIGQTLVLIDHPPDLAVGDSLGAELVHTQKEGADAEGDRLQQRCLPGSVVTDEHRQVGLEGGRELLEAAEVSDVDLGELHGGGVTLP